MANKKHLTILNQGAGVWNKWRENNPNVTPDLRGANLKEKKLAGCDFSGADIRGTNFKGAELERAKFLNAKAGLQFSSFLLRYFISLVFFALSAFLSMFIFGALVWLIIANEYLLNITDGFFQIAIAISFSIFFLVTMIVAIRRGKFYSLSLSLSVAGAVAGAVAVKGSMRGAFEMQSIATSVFIMLLVLERMGIRRPEVAKTAIVLTTGISTAIVMCYIGWRTLKEDEQFAVFRKFGLSFSSWGGTNFRSANLQGTDFSAAFLKGTCFDKETDLTNVCWKNALKAQFAQFSGTIMENRLVRELLVNHKSTDNTFTGLNFKGAYLRGADLRSKDFRYTDLRSADIREADITGIRLYGASREEWKIEGVVCDYVYLDEKGEERYPKEKNFAPGEFEELYKNIAAINEDLIERFIEFPPEYHQAGISILNYFGKVLKSKYPDTKAKIKIEQDGLKVKMVIDPIDGGDREIIEKTLGDYGLVITGQMAPEEFTDDRLLLIELKSELRMAQVRIETQKELLNDKSAQIDKLLSLVGQAVQSKSDVTVNIKQREENRQIQARTIQGMTQADSINTHSQKYITEETMGDTINITAQGDVAFAKDQAIAMVNKKIAESEKITATLEDKLKELAQAVSEMVRDMPDEKAKEIAGDLQTLVDEAGKDEPRRKWYELSGEGLIEAAKAVGSLGKPVIETTQAVLKLLGS
jgi:uncharacterized protein YjbI with pentapeptide repeats